ncbi:MAG TPA: ATP-binding protein [Hyphomicrobiaceae bacterium]|nr:ATP-binding protein [Hyphomicrobiaceae bacterium]
MPSEHRDTVVPEPDQPRAGRASAFARAGQTVEQLGLTPHGLVAIAGYAMLAASVTRLAGPIGIAHVAIILSGSLLALALALAARARTVEVERPAAPLPDSETVRDAEWSLRESEARLRALLDHHPDAILRRDPSGNLTYANRTAERLLGEAGQLPETVRDGGDCCRPIGPPDEPRWLVWSRKELPDVDGLPGGIEIIGRDITETRAAEIALARRRDEAQSASEAKSRFLASMSHEIRTPMNGILGMATLLRDTSLSADQATYVDAVDRSAKALLKLVNGILDLSKVEAGRMELLAEPVSLSDCVGGVIELLAPNAAEKGLELAWTMSADLPATIPTDEMRVRQILLNLIGNAIKFTDAGGVAVRIERRGEGIAVRIADTGPGIAPAVLASLFAEFVQADTAIQRRIDGSGLGLAISRSLARALGGEIEVVSKLGEGSEFTMLLPVPGMPAASALPVKALASEIIVVELSGTIEQAMTTATIARAGGRVIDVRVADHVTMSPIKAVVLDTGRGEEKAAAILKRVREVSLGLRPRGIIVIDASERDRLPHLRTLGFDAYLVRPVRPQSLVTQIVVDAAPLPIGPVPDPSGPVRPDCRLPDCRVLLVEDNDINALLTCRLLERLGVVVIREREGLGAVTAAEQHFDLVLLDIHMPGIDGHETRARLASLYRSSGRIAPPIIAVTAGAFPEDRKHCLDSGFDDYLAKPFSADEVAAMLAKWGNGMRSRRAGGIVC